MNSYKILFTLIAVVFVSGCSTFQKKGPVDPKVAEVIPKLKKPEVRKVWVPDQIFGDEYITGHWKYVLEKNSVWAKEK